MIRSHMSKMKCCLGDMLSADRAAKCAERVGRIKKEKTTLLTVSHPPLHHTKVIDRKNQIWMEIGLLAEKDPTKAGIHL